MGGTVTSTDSQRIRVATLALVSLTIVACGERASATIDVAMPDIADATATQDADATTNLDTSDVASAMDAFEDHMDGSIVDDASIDSAPDVPLPDSASQPDTADSTSLDDAWSADPDASVALPRDPVCERRLACDGEDDRCSAPIGPPFVATCPRWLHAEDRTGAMFRAVTPMAALRVPFDRSWLSPRTKSRSRALGQAPHAARRADHRQFCCPNNDSAVRWSLGHRQNAVSRRWKFSDDDRRTARGAMALRIVQHRRNALVRNAGPNQSTVVQPALHRRERARSDARHS